MIQKWKKIKDLIAAIQKSEYNTNLAKYMNANILAINAIDKLVDKNYSKYIPFTDYSLSPYTIAHILNDLIINSRKNVVEFGSGTSTIYIALFLQKHNDGQKFVSFDQNYDWQETLRSIYLSEIEEEVRTRINLVHAPILPTEFGKMEEAKWYDEHIVNSSISGKVDCIIVDGPTGDIIRYARYPVINFILKYLSDDGVVFIDDATREDEKVLIDDLVEKHSFKKQTTLYHSLLTRKKTFYTRPVGSTL